MLVHVNHCLLLWYVCIVWMVLGVRIDTLQDNRIDAVDVRDIVVTSAVFLAWVGLTLWLYRWAARPPSRRSLVRQARQTLTALANGFEPEPTSSAPFGSLMTARGARAAVYPRFVAPGVEFGNLRRDGRPVRTWRYAAVALPAPLPHFVLDSSEARGGDVPRGVERGQRLSLEGDFDRWFRLHVPSEYQTDALFVFTPDLMAALIDDARSWNVELVDDRVVFFAPGDADFSDEDVWRAIEALFARVVPLIAERSARYLDERVASQTPEARVAAMTAAMAKGISPVRLEPRIDPHGRRLHVRRRNAVLSAIGAVGWFLALVFLYVVPGLFAFAGFMSVVDGR
ncbi:hypothetical protein GCM10022202_17190 [Microbacterium marinilacus]|uniref:Uncharacterized protein n=1 Tax=Microbacterium marinilacus TaxID=415209 RepID=A0ABP7BEV2_9MICO